MPLCGHSWRSVAMGPDTEGALIAAGGVVCGAQSRAGLGVSAPQAFQVTRQCRHVEAAGSSGTQNHCSVTGMCPGPHQPHRQIWACRWRVLALLGALDLDVDINLACIFSSTCTGVPKE